MEAAPVAEAGYRGMMSGRALVVPGVLNKLLLLVIRLSPRWAVRGVSRWLQERRQP
jgi:short-subunit dehydrogenase